MIKVHMNGIFKSKGSNFKKEKIDENIPGSLREKNLLGVLVGRLDNIWSSELPVGCKLELC